MDVGYNPICAEPANVDYVSTEACAFQLQNAALNDRPEAKGKQAVQYDKLPLKGLPPYDQWPVQKF